MKIKDKFNLDYDGFVGNGPITIVAFGDSVTQGCFELDKNDYEAVYHNLLKNKLLKISDNVPVNVINAGIGGSTAKVGVKRIDKQVLAHNPDLVIVCFGLNDVNNPIDEYLQSLKIIFNKCKNSGADVIFLTPNTLNYYVDENTDKRVIDYAAVTKEYQNGGRMDEYVYSAIKLATECGVTVCDCYSKWKELAKTCDTTKLLINGINHPTREMHELFAQSLFEIITNN